MKLKKHEAILAVVPEFCAGPGWSNQIVNVFVGNYADNTFRNVMLQCDELDSAMRTLFPIGVQVQSMMRQTIERMK